MKINGAYRNIRENAVYNVWCLYLQKGHYLANVTQYWEKKLTGICD